MHVVSQGWVSTGHISLRGLPGLYRLARRQLEEILAVALSGSTYPDPVPHRDICRWRDECDAKRHDDDQSAH